MVNKEVNGSQCTITFHVDDLKLSHTDPEEMIKMIDHLRSLYEELPNGEVNKMEVQRMDKRTMVLNYLGMDFGYSINGEVSISMRHYVEKTIREFPDPLRNKVILTPATAKLLRVRPEIPKL